MDKKTELAIDLGQVIYTNTINSLTQQRDELLGVLQIARNGLVQWHVPDNRYAALTAIDAVLAKSALARRRCRATCFCLPT